MEQAGTDALAKGGEPEAARYAMATRSIAEPRAETVGISGGLVLDRLKRPCGGGRAFAPSV